MVRKSASKLPFGERRVTSISGKASAFLTLTPLRLTSSGSCAEPSDTRFCTSTLEMSRSEPTSKATDRVICPLPALVDFMYSMFSTPLTFCSSGVATDCSTFTALAPS
ncbi:hypothetical protein D3C72_2001290 [compost metagenome]